MMKFLLYVVCILSIWSGQCTAQVAGHYERYNLSLSIVVKYPECQLTDRGFNDELFLVGNGFGLSWTKSKKIEKIKTDTWQINFVLKQTPSGYSCQECPNNSSLPSGIKFEYRVISSAGFDMIGANFGIPMPTSKMSSYFSDAPVFYCYPYFFSNTGRVEQISVDSPDPYIGPRVWGYYLPPSFLENSYKKYPVMLAYDFGYVRLEKFHAFVEDMTVKNALSEESVVIGSDDYNPILNWTNNVRSYYLTPTEGASFVCFNGTGNIHLDNCNGCIPSNITDWHEKLIYVRDHCGYAEKEGGYGDAYLDYYLQNVLPAVDRRAMGRLLTDRSNMAIGGCSLGGLMACHALWTRPETVHAAACQSSSFWWPTLPNADNGFHFLNVTLKTRTGPRLQQKVYIDVGDLEDDLYGKFFSMLGAALEVASTMERASPQFDLDKTLWLDVITGQVHGGLECLSRMYLYIGLLFEPQGGPRNPTK